VAVRRRLFVPLAAVLALGGGVASCTGATPAPSVTADQIPLKTCLTAQEIVEVMQVYGDGAPGGSLKEHVVCADSYSLGLMRMPAGNDVWIVVQWVGSGYEIEAFDYSSGVPCRERAYPFPLFVEMCRPGPS